VADPHDLDHQPLIDDFVQDPIVANANPVDRMLSRQGNTPRWPWLTCEKINCRTNT